MINLVGMVHFPREIGLHFGLPQKVGCLVWRWM